MNHHHRRFDVGSDGPFNRVVTIALALLALAAVLAATLQIAAPAFGGSTVARVVVVGHASSAPAANDPPAAEPN